MCSVERTLHLRGGEEVGHLVSVRTERAESLSQPVALGWKLGGKRPTLGMPTAASFADLQAGPLKSPQKAPLPGIVVLSSSGWLLLSVDYSLKCWHFSPMLLHTTEIPFHSNEVSVQMLERRKPFN